MMKLSVEENDPQLISRSANHQPQPWWLDPTWWSLILINILTIWQATSQHWSLATIMANYWCQSVAIGFFNFLKILNLSEFSTSKLRINGRSVAPTAATKIWVGYFFLVHYGFFHLAYLIFLVDMFRATSEIWQSIWPTAMLFFLNHAFSYFYYRPQEIVRPNLGQVMFHPYWRIIPMHLTILAASWTNQSLVFFLILKTVADAGMHSVQHQLDQKNSD